MRGFVEIVEANWLEQKIITDASYYFLFLALREDLKFLSHKKFHQFSNPQTFQIRLNTVSTVKNSFQPKMTFIMFLCTCF